MITTAAVALAVFLSWNHEDIGKIPTPERSVTVCVDGRHQTMLAEKTASRIFQQIGVTLKWLKNPRTCPADALILSLTDETPLNLLPGALAYAKPYEGIHIRVFADRVMAAYDDPQHRLCGRVLGHVFAHEIGHMLQGVSRHSAEGVMKGKWTSSEMGAMRAKSLTFNDLDIRLIHHGVDTRTSKSPASAPAILTATTLEMP
jgi:hypothetical protein